MIVSIAVPEISICQSDRIAPRGNLIGIGEEKISIESNGREGLPGNENSRYEHVHMKISKYFSSLSSMIQARGEVG